MQSSFRRLGNCLIVSNMVGSLYDPFSAKSVVIPAGLLSSSWILVPFPLKTKWGGRQPSFEDTIVIHVTRSHVRWWFCLTTVSQPLNERDFCFEVSFLCNGIWSMPMTGMSIPTVLWKNTLTRRMFFNASRIRRYTHIHLVPVVNHTSIYSSADVTRYQTDVTSIVSPPAAR